MSFVRGEGSGYVHSAAITLTQSFPACDAVLCIGTGNPTITLKSGTIVALTGVAANSVLPLAATLITGTGTYLALYR
jgi:hypothetical protein